MQPEFSMPDFMLNNSAEEIHERMMNSLPADIDDMPGGFPFDFTMPAALEKDELINYHMVRALMIAFPQYAWDEWLDLHGKQVHLERHQAQKASGKVMIEGISGTKLQAGTVFCTPATDTGPSIEYSSDSAIEIGDEGYALINVTAVISGVDSNTGPNTVTLMSKPNRYVSKVNNPAAITGGTERESNDSFYDRIAAEYDNSLTYLGNDRDFIRWAKEAGAGDCVVVPAAEGPGTVKLVLIDSNGQPANEELVNNVYEHIVSPDDRSKRLLPTACAKLICGPAETVNINYSISGIVYDEGITGIAKIKEDFAKFVKDVYANAKEQGVLRYNDVRPVIKGIAGVTDFDLFLMNGEMKNINLESEEYPATGSLDFTEEE